MHAKTCTALSRNWGLGIGKAEAWAKASIHNPRFPIPNSIPERVSEFGVSYSKHLGIVN